MKFTKKLTLCGTECRLQEYLKPIYKKGAGKAKREPVSNRCVRIANADKETAKKLNAIAMFVFKPVCGLDIKPYPVFIRCGVLKMPKTVAEYERIFANKSYNAKKRKAKFKDIVACNPDLQRFMTLTFSENLTDVSVANAYFHLFMTKLRALAGKSFKYVCVIEFQERGAVHYHLLHNAKYIRSAFLAEMWGKGFVQNKTIDTRKNNNACAYLSSYMTKASEREKLGAGKKAFHCSQNCVRPVVLENTDFFGAGAMANILMKLRKSHSPKYAYEYSICSDYRDNYCNVVVYPLDFRFFCSILQYEKYQGELRDKPADIIL